MPTKIQVGASLRCCVAGLPPFHVQQHSPACTERVPCHACCHAPIPLYCASANHPCTAELLLGLPELCRCVARLEVQAGLLGIPMRYEQPRLVLEDYVEQLVLGAPRGCADRVVLLAALYLYFAPVRDSLVLRFVSAGSLLLAAQGARQFWAEGADVARAAQAAQQRHGEEEEAAQQFAEQAAQAAQAAQLWEQVAQAADGELAALRLPHGRWSASPFVQHGVRS